MTNDQSSYGLLGSSPLMKEVVRTLRRYASLPYPVLIEGETGTGKELAARAIHAAGRRSMAPLLSANCGAIPDSLVVSELFGHVRGAFTGAEHHRPGLFELAHGGTLFLDEAEAMSRPLQEALLRVIQDGEIRAIGSQLCRRVDVRIVAATNERLEDLVEQRGFRRDLFFRLNVLRLRLPPLHHRTEDIPLLIAHFLRKIARETGTEPKKISSSAHQRLIQHSWPGNVRELESAIRRTWALSEEETLDVQDFHFLEAPPERPGEILSLDDYIGKTLREHTGQMRLYEIAAKLGISRKTLWEYRRRRADRDTVLAWQSKNGPHASNLPAPCVSNG